MFHDRRYAGTQTLTNHARRVVALVIGLIVLAGCGGGSGSGAAIGRYVVTDVGPDDNGVAGPNEAGQLVGPLIGLGCGDGFNVNGCYSESPFVYTPGHALQTVQQKGSLQGINNRGDIIGFGPDGLSFIIQGGRRTSLGTLGGQLSQAYGINDSGQVVGSSLPTNSSSNIHAFLWQAGRMTDIGGIPGFQEAEAFGINNRGDIVGDCSVLSQGIRAAYWHDGVVDNLGASVGESEALAINNSGEIVGWAVHPDGSHATAWKNGVALDLGPGIAVFVDDAGNALGSVPHRTDSSSSHATLWNCARATDLNTLIDPASGWVLQTAYGMNRKGQIGGSGTHNGLQRAFLLTPR